MINLPVVGSVTCMVDNVHRVYELDDNAATYTYARNEIVVQKALPNFHLSVNVAVDWTCAPVAGKTKVDIVKRSGFGTAAQMQTFKSAVSYVDPGGETMYIATTGTIAIDIAVTICSVRLEQTRARAGLLGVACFNPPKSRPASPLARASYTRPTERVDAGNDMSLPFSKIDL